MRHRPRCEWSRRDTQHATPQKIVGNAEVSEITVTERAVNSDLSRPCTLRLRVATVQNLFIHLYALAVAAPDPSSLSRQSEREKLYASQFRGFGPDLWGGWGVRSGPRSWGKSARGLQPRDFVWILYIGEVLQDRTNRAGSGGGGRQRQHDPKPRSRHPPSPRRQFSTVPFDNHLANGKPQSRSVRLVVTNASNISLALA